MNTYKPGHKIAACGNPEALELEPVITVKRAAHRFQFFVEDNGSVFFTLDGVRNMAGVQEIAKGKVLFRESIEILSNNDVEFLSSLSLNDLDFATLKGKQNEILEVYREKNDTVKEWSLSHKDKKELLSMVDKWQKKTATRTRSDSSGNAPSKKIKEKYAIHTFTVGSEKIRMIERFLNGQTIINPDYKIYPNYPKAGGVGSREGELLVWKYYFEEEEASAIGPSRKKGYWAIAREMRYTEQICYEIITRYGYGKSLEGKTK